MCDLVFLKFDFVWEPCDEVYCCNYEQFVYVVVLGGWVSYVVVYLVDILKVFNEDMYVMGLVFSIG